MSYELVSHNATYYDPEWDTNIGLNFEEICMQSWFEDMNTLGPGTIERHPLGMAMINKFVSGHGVVHNDVVSYAGVTGFEEYNGENLAVIGGIITLPTYRNKGLGTKTVEGLLSTASTPEMVAEHEHLGFIARCNKDSKLLTDKLGFTCIGEELGKFVMIKIF